MREFNLTLLWITIILHQVRFLIMEIRKRKLKDSLREALILNFRPMVFYKSASLEVLMSTLFCFGSHRVDNRSYTSVNLQLVPYFHH